MKIRKIYEVKSFATAEDEKKFFRFVVNRYITDKGNLRDPYITTPVNNKFSFNFGFYKIDEKILREVMELKDFFSQTMNCNFTITSGGNEFVIIRFVTEFQYFFDFLDIEDYNKKTIDEILVELDAKKYNL